jgi:hypothetical protein
MTEHQRLRRGAYTIYASDGRTWSSIGSAATDLGVTDMAISSAARGVHKSVCGLALSFSCTPPPPGPRKRKQVPATQTLSALRPDIAVEYSTRNSLSPEQVSARPSCAKVQGQTRRRFSLPPGKSLADARPDVAAQWSSNNPELPSQISWSSGRRRLFICTTCKREWEAKVSDRTTNNSGCPWCYTGHTNLEKTFESLLEKERFNRYVGGLPYRPDIKLNDTTYANADGVYYHSQNPSLLRVRDTRYHFKMREDFEAAGLRLLQFYEDEILEKSHIVKSIVGAVCGSVQGRIYARKCDIRDVPETQSIAFLDANHLIGRAYMCKYVGLYFEDRLVHIMAYRRPGATIEIVRSCGPLDTVVVGGFQRLLAHLIRTHNPERVETLIDLRYATGHSLERAGFVRTGVALGYEYTRSNRRRGKRDFRVPAGVDEEAEAAKQGFFRIYNAGRAKYVLTPPPMPGR